MRKRILGFLLALFIGTAALFPLPVSAAACPSNPDSVSIIGLKSWWRYLDIETVTSPSGGSSCEVKQSNFEGDNLVPTIWKIALTILSDLFFVAGVLATVYIMYAGVMYITSNGDPGAAAKAKKALTSAIVGLVIVLAAHLIVNTILNLIA
ncbi:hypothetical protein IJ380_02250 [Candidatus Saccharibacteria bacterium]|nr:hypothetical protein [Candidatus Saccharibacteria bacterium]